MKADTFAKLVVLDALVEAEVGHYLRDRPAAMELYREGMVSRLSDLIDEIDVLDSVAAGRAYDAVVDFLAELPEEEDGIVEASTRFHQAVARIVGRGLDRRDMAEASTWAIVLGELLRELGAEYRVAIAPDGGFRGREYARAEALLDRARQTADRMLWNADTTRPEITSDLNRLTYAVRYGRTRPGAVEQLIRAIERRAAKYRPSTITRVGAFIIRQLVRREPRRRRPLGEARARRGKRSAGPGR